MKKLFKKILTKWVVKNFPFQTTTQVDKYYTVRVKKGKIREWRTYSDDGVRQPNVIK